MKRTLVDPLYHQRVDMCDTHDDFLRAANRRCRRANLDPYTADDLKDTSALVTEIDGALVVGIFDHKLSTLAHECVHLATRTLRIHGVPITCQNDEALAYMVGWYFSAWTKRMGG